MSADDWFDELLRKADGITARKAYANTVAIVRNHPDYAGKWARNEMADRAELDGKQVPDGAVGDIIAMIEREYSFTATAADVVRAIGQACDDKPYHPVRRYLESQVWDGTERLGSIARDFLWTDNALHADMVARWTIGAVARVLWPGCKLDTALVLTGAQGVGKSSFFRVLGGEWFTDTHMAIGDKDGLLQLHSSWILEWGELELVSNARSEARVKQFLASAQDMFRAPYGRATAMHPRSVVIVGSTNEAHFLTDVTGSRRFWVVPVAGRVNLADLAAVRDQLWAEAVVKAKAGQRWWLDESQETAREAEAEAYQVEDSWTPLISVWVAGHPEFAMGDVLGGPLGIEPARWVKADEMRASKILRKLGFQRGEQARRGGKRDRLWRRGGDGSEGGGAAPGEVVPLRSVTTSDQDREVGASRPAVVTKR